MLGSHRWRASADAADRRLRASFGLRIVRGRGAVDARTRAATAAEHRSGYPRGKPICGKPFGKMSNDCQSRVSASLWWAVRDVDLFGEGVAVHRRESNLNGLCHR